MRTGWLCRIIIMLLAGAMALALTPVAASAQGTSPPARKLAGPHPQKPRPRQAASATIPGPMYYFGGPVQTAPRVYVDFWGWASDPNGERPYLTRFLGSVGGTSWLATVNQYGAGSPAGLLAGTWSDPAPVPATPSDAQIQQEAVVAAGHFGTGTSVNVEIVVATPTGHSTPGFGTQWCAYHDAVQNDPGVTYTNLPYMTDAGFACGQGSVNGAAGTLDGVSIVEGHELAETITDPLLNAWFDLGGNEIGDKCAWTGLANINTLSGTFAVQPLWSNAANGCVLGTGSGDRGSEIAFQANTTDLWVTGSAGTVDTHLGMMPGTSPSIALLPGGGYEVAFQASTTHLWVYGTAGTGDTGLGMLAGTSPSVTGLAAGGFQVAFQANTLHLWVYGSAGTGDTGLGMLAGTAPSIARLASGYEVAFQANTGHLWVYGSAGTRDTGLGMLGGTSPSVAGVTGGYEVAFQANTTHLWVYGSVGTGDTGLGMLGGTGPGVAGLAGGGFEAAFQANTTSLWVYGSSGTGDLHLGVLPGTSPSIAPV